MSNRKRRLKLWNKDPHCYYCGRLTVERSKDDQRKPGELPDKQATLEHLRSRLDPTRQEPCIDNNERTVLACRECNETKAAEEELLLSKEELWERSKRHPKGIML